MKLSYLYQVADEMLLALDKGRNRGERLAVAAAFFERVGFEYLDEAREAGAGPASILNGERPCPECGGSSGKHLSRCNQVS